MRDAVWRRWEDAYLLDLSHQSGFAMASYAVAYRAIVAITVKWFSSMICFIICTAFKYRNM